MPRVFLPQILWHSKDNKHCDRVYSIDFQPQNAPPSAEGAKNSKVSELRLATGGADEFVHIWQIRIHELAPQYTCNKTSFNALSADSNDQPLTVRILARLVGHVGEVNAVRWNHFGNLLATGGEDRCIFLWEKGENGHGAALGESFGGEYEEYWSRTKHYRLSNVVNSICWCPDDRILAVSTEDGHVSLVDTWVEGSKIRYFEGHTSFAQGVSICPKNMLVASMGSDQSLRIWKRKGEKSWTNVLVLRTARDRPEPLKESEYNIKSPDLDDRRYGRSVFMSEELKTFFRRLDWSPDGRFLVTPAGIRFNLPPAENDGLDPEKSRAQETTGATTGEEPLGEPPGAELGNGTSVKVQEQQDGSNPTVETNVTGEDKDGHVVSSVGDDPLYTLYIFHRKLIHLGLPMMTHISPTGAFVVVRFCPMELTKLERQRINFFNTFANGNVKDIKIKTVKRIKRTSSLTSQPSIGIKDFFVQPLQQGDVKTISPAEVCADVKSELGGGEYASEAVVKPSECDGALVANSHEGPTKAAPLCDDNGEPGGAVAIKTEDVADASEIIKGSAPEPQGLEAEQIQDNNEGDNSEASQGSDDASTKESDTEQTIESSSIPILGKRIVKKPKFYHEDFPSNDNTSTRSKPKTARKPKAKQLPEEKEYDTDMEDDVLIPRFMFAVGTIDGSLCFYDTRETSGPIAVLKNLHFCTITDIAWSPDGLVCASSSSDGYVTFVIFAKTDFY